MIYEYNKVFCIAPYDRWTAVSRLDRSKATANANVKWNLKNEMVEIKTVS